MSRHLFIAILIALAVYGCDSNDPIEAVGTLERDLIRLSAPSSEIITAVHAQEGDTVTPGTSLLDLDDTAASAEVERIKAELKQAAAYLSQLQRGAREEEIASAKARAENAEAIARAAEKSYRRAQQLVRQNLMSQSDLDAALASRDSTRAVLEDAREQWLLLQHGTRSELIEQAQAHVDEIEHALTVARKHLDDLHITATRSGRIDSLPWKLGERVPAGAVLAVLLADDNLYVRAYAPEAVRAQLQVGTQLPVRVDGVATPIVGTLIHVQRDPAFSPHYALTATERSRLMYLIKVKLDDSAIDLPSGIPAQVILDDPDNESP